MPIVANVLELIADVIWSRVPVEPNHPIRENHKYAAKRTSLFVVPIGLWGVDRIDTNMTNAGQLPVPQSFNVRAARTLFLSMGIPLSFKHPLWWNSLIELRVGMKTYIECPTFTLMDPIALLTQDRHPKVEELLAHRSEGILPHVISPEIEIECGMGFNALLTHQVEDLPPACEFLFVLEGEKKRGIM